MSKSDEGIVFHFLPLFAMEHVKYSIGIDVAKETFNACISVIDQLQKVTIKGTSSFKNTAQGFKDFYVWSCKHAKENIPVNYLMEATGIYHENLAWFLYGKDCSISVILPNKAKKYIQSLGLKSKNDKI